MPPLAHHAGEEALAPLLLLGGCWITLAAAAGRAHLAAARDRLHRGPRRSGADYPPAGPSQQPPTSNSGMRPRHS